MLVIVANILCEVFMMSIFKELKKIYFVGAILSILLGIVLLFFPQTTLLTICYAFALILGVVGIGYIFTYIKSDTLKTYQRNDFVVGLTYLVLAVFVSLKTELVISLLPILLGLSIIISSIVKLQHAFDLMRVKFNGWWWVLLIAVSSAAIGLYLVVHPFTAAATMVRVIGIAAIWNGVADIGTGILFLKKIKEAIQVMGAIDSEAEEID